MKRYLTSFAPLLLLLLMVASVARAQTNPGIAPIQSHPHGHSYSQWAARWWQWALEAPAPVNPLTDTTGVSAHEGQSGHVFFLAGSRSSAPLTRTVTIGPGQALFFPLYNFVYFAFLNDPPDTRTEAFLRAQVVGIETAVDSIPVTIDGVPVKNPKQYLEKSVLFDVFLPVDNLYGLTEAIVPELTFSPCADEGYYLFLDPLPPGEHTLRWRVIRVGGGVAQDITYHLTVQP
jgi:hypothetical protein